MNVELTDIGGKKFTLSLEEFYRGIMEVKKQHGLHEVLILEPVDPSTLESIEGEESVIIMFAKDPTMINSYKTVFISKTK